MGVFPYSGADITLRTQKIPPDNFDFNPALHRFRILSSSTLYTNSPADTSALLAAAPVVSGAIVNPGVDVYQSKEAAFSMPLANQYLYLIWDFRLISEGELCYCTPGMTPMDACCDCTVTCNTCWFGPKTYSAAASCATDTDTIGSAQWSFNGTGSIPVLGNLCYENADCDYDEPLPSGFYIVDTNSPSTTSPKNWIELDGNGIVVQSTGTC